MKKYGADLIRLWIASEDFRHDITLSENIFKQVSNTYRGLRNTLMYLLGNLAGFDPVRDAAGPAHFTPLDKWVLHKLHALVGEVTAAFDAYDFHLGVKAIDQFVSVTLSRQYHDILKDRLYTFAPDVARAPRRANRHACHSPRAPRPARPGPALHHRRSVEPPHRQSDFTDDSIHLQPWPLAEAAWSSPAYEQAAGEIDAILKFRERVNEKLEALRQEKKIGKFLDAQVTVAGSDAAEPMAVLRRHADALPELFIVSQVRLVAGAPATSGDRRRPRRRRALPAQLALGAGAGGGRRL